MREISIQVELFDLMSIVRPSHQKKNYMWTYKSDAMSRRGAQCPGAGLLAGIPVRPVGAADGARHSGENLITAS